MAKAKLSEVDNSYNGFEIDSDVEMGPRSRLAPRQAKYPFDMLQPGQSFHVPATEEMPKPGITLAGAVTNANNKWSHETGQYETKLVSVFEVGPDGKRVKTAEGEYIKTGQEQVQKPVLQYERHFSIRSATADDVRGPGARVFRDI
jgi:hypothetical protein